MSSEDNSVIPEKRFLNISPLNGSGRYSYSSGNNIVRFEIGSSGLLSAPEVRYQGTLRCYSDTALTTRVVSTDDININPVIGCQSMISDIHISSLRYSSKVLERIDNYPRLCSSLLSAIGGNKNDFDNNLSHEQLSRGLGNDDVSQVKNGNYLHESIIFTESCQGQIVKRGQRKYLQRDFTFSMRLICGLLQGSTQIDLDQIGGLVIEIHLANDSNFFFGGDAANARFEVIDPQLTAPLLTKSLPMEVMSERVKTPVFTFLSFSSLYNVVSSTSSSVVHRMNKRAVLSLFQNLIPVGYINNPAQDSGALYNPQVRTLEYHKDGIQFPLQYTQSSNYQDNVAALQQKTNDPQIIRNYLSAFRNFLDIKDSLLSPLTLSPLLDRLGLGCYSQGVSFDMVTFAGVPLVNSNITTNLDATLDDPANPGNPTNYGLYTFFLEKNSVVVQPDQGVIVVS